MTFSVISMYNELIGVVSGKGVGSLLTGWLYKELGMRWAWRVYGISSIVFLLVYIIVNKTVFKKSSTEMIENQRELGNCLSIWYCLSDILRYVQV